MRFLKIKSQWCGLPTPPSRSLGIATPGKKKMFRRSMLRAALILASIHAQTPPPALAICARCKREQRSNQRSFEMTDRQSSYEPPVVVQGERVPTPMGRVPASKLDSPRGAVV